MAGYPHGWRSAGRQGSSLPWLHWLCQWNRFSVTGLVNGIQSSLTNIDFIIQLYSFIRQERFALGCGTLRKFARQIGARTHKRGNQWIGFISKLLVQRLWTIWQLNIYGVFYIFLFSCPRCITALQVSNPDSKEFSCVCAQNVLNLNGCKLR